MNGFGAAELQAVIALLQNLSGLATVGFFMWLIAVHVVPWVVPFWALVRLSQAGFGWLDKRGDETRKLRGLRNMIVGPSDAAVSERDFLLIVEMLGDGVKWRELKKEEPENE